MGKIMSILVVKPLRNFNVESRAHKVISKEKPTPAPRHKSDQLGIEQMIKEYPEQYQESLQKHEALDKYLKEVYVKSHGPEVKPSVNPDRPLPLDRGVVGDFELGYREPEKIPLGKVTLKSAVQFIRNHQLHPNEYTAQKISEQHSLPEEAVKNVLRYFKIHELYIPDNKRMEHVQFVGPPVKRSLVKKHELKRLGPGDERKQDPN